VKASEDSVMMIDLRQGARAWPSRLVDLETQACQVIGDESHEQLSLRTGARTARRRSGTRQAVRVG
jgi:hypothetical protein